MAPLEWIDIKPAVLSGDPIHHRDDGKKTGFASMTMGFQVPLDHRKPLVKTDILTLHATLVYAEDSISVTSHAKDNRGSHHLTAQLDDWFSEWVHTHWRRILRRRPFLVYLCGGPGDGNDHRRIPELNRFALELGYQILYVDYRGTGRSRPFVDGAHLAGVAPSTADRAAYLSLFRQDNIVRDFEAIRLCLTELVAGDNGGNDPPPSSLKKVKWTLLGQSFGGWVALTYLSFLPTSLAAVYLTAGLAPVGKSPRDVYARLYRRVAERNEAYYAAYPEDQDRIRTIASHLRAHSTRYTFRADGYKAARQRLTAQTFMTLGRSFGSASENATFQRLHRLVERMVGDIGGGGSGDGELSEETVDEYAAMQGSSSNRGRKNSKSGGGGGGGVGKKGGSGFRLHERPLYGVLHEAIYCHSPTVASGWAAQTIGRTYGNGEFAWLGDGDDNDDNDNGHDVQQQQKQQQVRDGTRSSSSRLFFSGEMVFPFMLASAGAPLRAFAEAANALAAKTDWPRLYDEEQLARNKVPVRAVAYPHDMYVDFDLSIETGAKIRNCVVLEGKKEWEHGAIKDGDKSAEVLRMLFGSETVGS